MIISGVYGELKNDFIENQILQQTKAKIKNQIIQLSKPHLIAVAGNILSTGDQGTIFTTDNSLLVGTTFDKTNNRSINQKELEIVLKKSDEFIIDNYWGAYILLKLEDKQLKIVRAPVSQFPLFYTICSDGRVIFSSDMSILHEIITPPPGFNFSYLSSYLINAFLTSEQTPFQGVYELIYGCQLSLTQGAAVQQSLWDPIKYNHYDFNKEEMKIKILSSLQNLLATRLSTAESIFLDFSGGLDSSALLFMLNELVTHNQKIYPVNFFHPKVQSSDERFYTKKISKELNIDYMEFDCSLALPFSPAKNLNKPNWPTSHLVYAKMERTLFDLASTRENKIFVSGHGGDHLFLSHPPIEALCDFLLEQGGQDFFKKVKELATIYRKPLTSLVGGVLKGFYHHLLASNTQRSPIPKTRKAPWFSEDIFNFEKKMQYYTFLKTRQERILPGKLKHINAIYNGLSSLKGEIRDIGDSMFYPYLSQPLIELALTIPSYESFNSGYTRYLFRKTMSDKFNTNSIWRKDKGETSGVIQRGISENRDFVMDICLNGSFASQKLVDRNCLYDNIKRLIAGQKDYQWNIVSLFSAELFINLWKK